MTSREKRDAEWAEAKKKCRLNVETVKMAKEMGLNPRSLIKNIPNKSEPRKAPVAAWIREMYQKRHGRALKYIAPGQGYCSLLEHREIQDEEINYEDQGGRN